MSPQRSTRPFTVVHVNGIHQVNIWFCACNLAVHHGDCVQQLLRRRLFPATTTDPQSGSTFSLLESAHILSVQLKLSLYDYYISIETLTDATRVSVKVILSIIDCCYLSLTFTEGSLQSIPSYAQNVVPSAPLETRRESPRPNQRPGHRPWRACSIVPCLPLSKHQPPNQLEVSSKGHRVCARFHHAISSTYTFPDTFITRASASMLVSVSNTDRYQATRRILSWVLDSHTSLYGNHTENTFGNMWTKAR